MAEYTDYVKECMPLALPAEVLADLRENSDTITGATITVEGEPVWIYTGEQVDAWLDSWQRSYAEGHGVPADDKQDSQLTTIEGHLRHSHRLNLTEARWLVDELHRARRLIRLLEAGAVVGSTPEGQKDA